MSYVCLLFKVDKYVTCKGAEAAFHGEGRICSSLDDRHDCAGKDIYGEGHQAVMGEMMMQGSGYSHVPVRRTVWLRAMLPLLQARPSSPRKVVAISSVATFGDCQSQMSN